MEAHFETWILEACILNILVSKDAYGYELAKSDMLKISDSAIYPVLRRLTDKGCLTVSSHIHEARLRKIYRITPEGRNRLIQLKAEWHVFQKNVNEILESSTPILSGL